MNVSTLNVRSRLFERDNLNVGNRLFECAGHYRSHRIELVAGP